MKSGLRVPVLAALLLLTAAIPAAAGAGFQVTVLDSQGKPAAGAEVHVLQSHNVHLKGGPDSLVLESLRTDENGHAYPERARRTSEICLFVFTKTECALRCAHLLQGEGAKGVTLRLAKGLIVNARLVDSDGKKVGQARVRAIVPGGQEIHGIDGRVDEEGVLRFPPIPADAVERCLNVGVEVYGTGFVPRWIPILDIEKEEVVDVVLRRPRALIGRVLTEKGEPILGVPVTALLRDDFGRFPMMPPDAPRTDADGRFRLTGVAQEAVVLYVIPGSHAPWSKEIEAGSETVDAGEVRVVRGLPVSGRMREIDELPIINGFVFVDDARGMRLRSASVDAVGRFTLPCLHPGTYEMTAILHRSVGVSGSRWHSLTVRAGDEDVDVLIPSGLRVRFVGGSDVPLDVASVKWRIEGHPGWPEGCDGREYDTGDPFHEIRIPVPGPAEFRVVVKARGYREVTAPARVDGQGSGEVKVVLVRIPGESLEAPHGGHFGDFREKSEELKKIRLPEKATKEQVRTYVREILATAKGRNRWSSRDPEVEMLIAVGPAHVDVLIDALVDSRQGSSYVRYALPELVGEQHKDLVVASLERVPALAEVIFQQGWAEAASKTLVAGVARHPSYLPPDWIRATALLENKATYPDLRHYLIHGLNRRHTWRAIRHMPGFDLDEAVRAMWEERADAPHDLMEIAVVAAESGIVPALGVLIGEYGKTDEDHRRPHDLDKIVVRLTGQRLPPPDLVAWFEKHRDALTFDPKAGVYRVK